MRVIVLVHHERSLWHCSVLAAACGWYRMERHGAQRCSSRSWIESDCMQTSVRDPQSVDAECDGSPVRGSWMITSQPRRVCRTSNAVLEGLRVLRCHQLQSATFTDVREDVDRSWLAVPMTSASDLSEFSWSPFCINESLTSAVQAARVDRNAAVLLSRIARCSWVSSAYCW